MCAVYIEYLHTTSDPRNGSFLISGYLYFYIQIVIYDTILFILICQCFILCIMKETYIRNAEVKSVTDGDTVVAIIDLGYHCSYTTPLRLARINAPELSTQDGKTSKVFLQSKIPVGTKIVVQTFKNPIDKYGRWLAELSIDDVNLNDLMVTSGYAKYWDGTGPKPV